jgi:hypothetical protein
MIEAQLKTLGPPLIAHEKISIVAVATSPSGFLNRAWHHINEIWVAMLSLLILFASSVLDEKAARRNGCCCNIHPILEVLGFDSLK